MLRAVISFVNVQFSTLFGSIVKKISHENAKIMNHGSGFSWGMSLEVVRGHQSLA